ncbi:MAG: hypothetical protein ACI9UA_005051 [Pseudoalteromonas tetraodonis]|jgi:hypothetical protein
MIIDSASEIRETLLPDEPASQPAVASQPASRSQDEDLDTTVCLKLGYGW